ncbi:MAG: hypothetical protein HYZ17_11760 [Betaproteobacteria bacterium]|nr:hypothetical protein [Betaproteobacteria bacterium]
MTELSRGTDFRSRKHILWGLALMLAGLVFLADRLGFLELGPFWTYWPMAIVVAGLIDLATAQTLKQYADGAFIVLLGAWIYVCKEHLWGWSFATTWPAIMVAGGASMIVDGLTRKNRNAHQESLS